MLVGFKSFMGAVEFANQLAQSTEFLVKEIAPIAAPIPFDCFSRHKQYIRHREQPVVVIMVAPHATEPVLALVGKFHGEVLFRSDVIESMTGIPEAFELTWNHTTLRAIKADKGFTYLQVQYSGPDHVEKVRRMTEIFGDEVPGHLEFIRFDGQVQCCGLPLVRFTPKERLEEIIRIHEENGCQIFNPHRYTLEEGGMKQTDKIQLAFKKETDPKGLLNPGKMIAWENPNYDFKSGKTYLYPGLNALLSA